MGAKARCRRSDGGGDGEGNLALRRGARVPEVSPPSHREPGKARSKPGGEGLGACDAARRTWIISTGLFDGHVAGGAAHGCGTICGCMWVDAAPICGSLCGGATMTRMGAG